MGIATIDVLLMHCLEWTSHVSVHTNLKVPISQTMFCHDLKVLKYMYILESINEYSRFS